eukprot:6513672-Prymnesium_polylepis.1
MVCVELRACNRAGLPVGGDGGERSGAPVREAWPLVKRAGGAGAVRGVEKRLTVGHAAMLVALTSGRARVLFPLNRGAPSLCHMVQLLHAVAGPSCARNMAAHRDQYRELYRCARHGWGRFLSLRSIFLAVP